MGDTSIGSFDSLKQKYIVLFINPNSKLSGPSLTYPTTVHCWTFRLAPLAVHAPAPVPWGAASTANVVRLLRLSYGRPIERRSQWLRFGVDKRSMSSGWVSSGDVASCVAWAEPQVVVAVGQRKWSLRETEELVELWQWEAKEPKWLCLVFFYNKS